jgi:sirohydrochlorin cobaltochelatase
MKALILIGHGGVPKDFPPDKIHMDHEIRNWPRTPENDPFCFGMQAIAERMQQQIPNIKLVIAYNEFCAPSIEDAVTQLVSDNYDDITLLTTMFTPGGVHSEAEIPEIARALRTQFPDVNIHYPWPFDLDLVAQFLLHQTNLTRIAVTPAKAGVHGCQPALA